VHPVYASGSTYLHTHIHYIMTYLIKKILCGTQYTISIFLVFSAKSNDMCRACVIKHSQQCLFRSSKKFASFFVLNHCLVFRKILAPVIL